MHVHLAHFGQCLEILGICAQHILGSSEIELGHQFLFDELLHFLGRRFLFAGGLE